MVPVSMAMLLSCFSGTALARSGARVGVVYCASSDFRCCRVAPTVALQAPSGSRSTAKRAPSRWVRFTLSRRSTASSR